MKSGVNNEGEVKHMTKTKIPEYLSKFAQDNNEDMIMTSNHDYVIAPQKILRCFRLNEIEKLVLFELLSYMGEKDYAFPSHKRLAFKLGKKSVSSIKKALNSLKDKGFIKWSKGGGDIGQIVIDYWSFVKTLISFLVSLFTAL